MNSIPIFDSLTHPTINGDWIIPGPRGRSNLNDLLGRFESNNIVKALAVGMKGIGDYDGDRYAEFILSHTDKLLPVAFFNLNDFRSDREAAAFIIKIKTLGYRGIKLHPRFGNFTITNPLIPDVIKRCNDLGLPVLLCTYFYSRNEGSSQNNQDTLLDLLEKVPDSKVILMHAGNVNLLTYVEIARTFKNTLLDLSFTMVKYAGSSLDADISYAFNNFDRRICVGSDHPEFSLESLRARFDHFASGLSVEKSYNIAFNNLNNFFGD